MIMHSSISKYNKNVNLKVVYNNHSVVAAHRVKIQIHLFR